MIPGQVVCAGCGVWYFPALARKHARCVVANGPVHEALVANRVVHEVANASPVVANKSRHGKYADPDKRRKYMRGLMAARRRVARDSKGA